MVIIFMKMMMMMVLMTMVIYNDDDDEDGGDRVEWEKDSFPFHLLRPSTNSPNTDISLTKLKKIAKEYCGKLQKRNNLPKFLFMLGGKMMQKT